MKILFLLPHIFIPPDKGNTYLIYNLLQHVTNHADCDIALLADINIDKEAAIRTIKKHFPSSGEIVIFNKPHGLRRSWERIRLLMSGYHQAFGNYWSKLLAEWLQKRITERHYDIVHFDMLYMTSYLPYIQNVHTVLVPSDAYSLTALNIYKGTSNIRHKARNVLEYLIMSNLERKIYPKFDLICPVAETDSAYLSTKVKHHRFKTVGVGVGENYTSIRPRAFEDNGKYGNRMLYAGPLFVPWVANDIIKFIKRSYPIIRERVPEARLTLLGKRPTPALQNLITADRSIHCLDFVEDYEGFLNRDWVYIHPQHGSAGYKTKIQQVMALGLPVVGSELAFTGMDVVPGEHCYLCKTEREFATNTIKLLGDRTLRSRIGLAAAEHIRTKYSIEKVGEAMMEAYRCIPGK